jgi:hypothetical protein
VTSAETRRRTWATTAADIVAFGLVSIGLMRPVDDTGVGWAGALGVLVAVVVLVGVVVRVTPLHRSTAVTSVLLGMVPPIWISLIGGTVRHATWAAVLGGVVSIGSWVLFRSDRATNET